MKKTLSLLIFLVLCICLSISVTAIPEPISTQELSSLISSINIDEELDNARLGVVDKDVSQNVLDSISISSNNIDNNISYTVNHIGTIVNKDNSVGNVYSLTAVSTKNTTGTTSEDNVNCWITLTWIDNFGTDNEIVRVSGGWESNGRTLYDRSVMYGVDTITGSFVEDQYETKFPENNSFNYTPSKRLSGLSLRAYSLVRSEGYDTSIYCNVRPTIFD